MIIGSGIAVFAVASLTCSALLPLSISFVGEAFPSKASTIFGGLIACYQIGSGITASASVRCGKPG